MKTKMLVEIIRIEPDDIQEDKLSLEEEADNLRFLVLDACGFPEKFDFEVKVLSKERIM